MCLLCIEIAKGSMTLREVANAYIEDETIDDHIHTFMGEIVKHYGIKGFEKIGKEISKIRKEREDETNSDYINKQ